MGYTSRWFIFTKHKYTWKTGKDEDHGNKNGINGEGNEDTKNREYR